MMKKLFAICLAMMVLVGLCLAEEPDTYTCDVWKYTLTENGAVITNWHYGDTLIENHAVVEIPAELNGHPVVGIGYNAFNTSFMGADPYFTLVIPEGIKWLEDDAFLCCHNAEVIVFPASLVEIPEYCFSHVTADIIIAEGNPRYIMQDGFLIDQQTSTLLYAVPSEDDPPIPAVRRLGSGSLENFGNWEQDVVIPEGVEEIGSYAFSDWAFRHVTLPASLRLIESMAFDVEITEPVIVPAGVEFVEHWAFSGCGTAIEVIAASESTHFETAEEFEARTGERHWMDDFLYEEE